MTESVDDFRFCRDAARPGFWINSSRRYRSQEFSRFTCALDWTVRGIGGLEVKCILIEFFTPQLRDQCSKISISLESLIAPRGGASVVGWLWQRETASKHEIVRKFNQP